MPITLTTLNKGLFNPGVTVITPGALDALAAAEQHPGDFLTRHLQGDWGELCEDDKAENQTALECDLRLMSAYRTSAGQKLWIITEADRSATNVEIHISYVMLIVK